MKVGHWGDTTARLPISSKAGKGERRPTKKLLDSPQEDGNKANGGIQRRMFVSTKHCLYDTTIDLRRACPTVGRSQGIVFVRYLTPIGKLNVKTEELCVNSFVINMLTFAI